MKPVIVFVLALMLISPAVAEDYQPLEIGYHWSYVTDAGGYEMRVVTAQVPVFGTNTYQIDCTISDSNQGLVNFWTSEPDGGILLHGFYRLTWGVAYYPPLRMVDAPLYVGKTWTETVDLFSLPDTTFSGTMEITFEVHEDPVLTVPAGEFETFGVGYPWPPPSTFLEARFNLMGEIQTGQRDLHVDHWYSLGVGVVQDNLDDLYQLETYFDHPVGVEVSAWGEVKALYRGTD